jgi:hypothetical protein
MYALLGYVTPFHVQVVTLKWSLAAVVEVAKDVGLLYSKMRWHSCVPLLFLLLLHVGAKEVLTTLKAGVVLKGAQTSLSDYEVARFKTMLASRLRCRQSDIAVNVSRISTYEHEWAHISLGGVALNFTVQVTEPDQNSTTLHESDLRWFSTEAGRQSLSHQLKGHGVDMRVVAAPDFEYTSRKLATTSTVGLKCAGAAPCSCGGAMSGAYICRCTKYAATCESGRQPDCRCKRVAFSAK